MGQLLLCHCSSQVQKLLVSLKSTMKIVVVAIFLIFWIVRWELKAQKCDIVTYNKTVGVAHRSQNINNLLRKGCVKTYLIRVENSYPLYRKNYVFYVAIFLV